MRRHSHDDVFRLQDQNAEYHSREKLIDKLFKAAVREREQESRKHYGGHFSELQKSPQNNAAEQKFFKNCRQQTKPIHSRFIIITSNYINNINPIPIVPNPTIPVAGWTGLR